jgi:hypothetical protein
MVGDDLGGFGDARLRAVGARLLAAMGDQPTTCLQALAADRNEAISFGRFLDHSGVSAEEMLTTAGRYTAERAVGRHVLAIQDTTEFNFPGHKASKRGFGTSGNGRDIGLFVHPTLAVDAASGGVIGLVGAQVINRTQGPASRPESRAFDDRESCRWLHAVEQAADVLRDADCVTCVGDRESDIYELYARKPDGIHLLTRVCRDRALADAGELYATIDSWPEQHRVCIELPPIPGRKARRATLVLRFGAVCLRRPKTADRTLAPQVDLYVVDVREVDAPAGVDPVHWRLLTTHEVRTVAQAGGTP